MQPTIRRPENHQPPDPGPLPRLLCWSFAAAFAGVAMLLLASGQTWAELTGVFCGGVSAGLIFQALR